MNHLYAGVGFRIPVTAPEAVGAAALCCATTCRTGMPRERLARLRRLDAAEPLHLAVLHHHLLAEPYPARGAVQERHAVRVERLVDRLHARRRALHAHLRRGLRQPLVPQVLDEGGAHGELDPVEGDEPDDVLWAQGSGKGFKRHHYLKKLTQTQTIPIHPPDIDWI